MLRVAQRDIVRDYYWRDRAQPLDNRSGLVQPAHVGMASRENAVRLREARLVLDREEQLRHGLIKPPAQKMRHSYYAA